MANNVDNRIVEMSFNNRSFESGVATTLGTLAKLKSALSFSGGSKGLEDIETSASKFNLNGVGTAITGASQRFSALSVVGVTALADISKRAVDAGIALGKTFTTGPIKAGFTNYETQINAVQTILANTGLTGKKGLDEVNASLSNLNTYANQTIYNFSDMAKSIGTFTAAGVKLGPATDAIKGIANLAAASGASADQASGAMYQLSQALSAGTFKLQDYNSVVNAGIGGKLFQTAIYNAAKAAGTLTGVKVNETYDQWTKAGNNFRASLQKGFVTTKVLTQALSSFTGDQTAAQLKAQGYTKAQILQTQQTARLAVDAATKIKTFSQLSDALKEEVGTAYAAIFKTIFGDINQAKNLFSSLHTTVENALTNPLYKFNGLLEDVAALGGRTNIIEGLKNVFKALGAVLKPVGEAFHEIFPPATAKSLNGLTVEFANFAKNLQPAAKTVANLKSTFAGIFAVFDIGKQIVQGIFFLFQGLFDSIPRGSKGILDITGNVGDFLVSLDNMLKEGHGLDAFFDHFYNALVGPVEFLGKIKNAIVDLFAGFSSSGAKSVQDGISGISDQLSPLQKFLDAAKSGFHSLGQDIDKLTQSIQPALHTIAQTFGNIGHTIADSLSQGGGFKNVLGLIQTGLLGGILLLVKKFFGKPIKLDVGGGLVGSIKESLEGVTGSLKAMQTQLKAKALLDIAAALGIIVAAVAVLSTINPKKMTAGLQGLAVGFGELLAGVGILTKVTGAKGAIKLPIIAAALVVLATAILTLSGAVKVLSTLSYDELKKGLGAVTILLGGLVTAAIALSKFSGSLVGAGVGLNAIAVALNVLFIAVKLYSTLDYKTMLRGLAGVAGALTAVAAAMHLMPKGMLLQAAAIGVIAVALNVLYLAVKQFSSFDYKTLARGLTGVAGSLGTIAGFLHLLPEKSMIRQSIAVGLVAASLLLLSKAVSSFGGESYTVLAKGLGAVGIALGELATALNFMDGTLPGAAALLVAAKAMAILVPVVAALGKIPFAQEAKGLGVLAAAIAIFVAAGYAADGAAPGLLALGVAAVGLGGGLALAGIGLKAIATGLGTLAKLGSSGVSVLLAAVAGFVAQIPAVAEGLAEGLVKVAQIIGDNAPTIVGAFVKILGQLLAAVVTLSPQLASAIEALLTSFLQVINDKAPDIIAAGLNLLLELLQGISDNIGKVTDQVGNIIVNFLNALTKKLPDIIAAGANFLVQFLEGISQHIGDVISAAGDVVANFVTGIGKQIGKIAKAGGDAIVSFINGVSDAIEDIANAGANLIIKFVKGMSDKAVDIVDAAGDAILSFLDGLDKAIKKYEPQIIEKCVQIGKDIIAGAIKGIGKAAGGIASSLKDAVGGALKSVGGWLGIGGPSKRFANEVGQWIPKGIAKGIKNNGDVINDSLQDQVHASIDNLKGSLKDIPENLGAVNVQPTITPVLDISTIKQQAKGIDKALNVQPITVTTSYASANALSILTARKQAADLARAELEASAQAHLPEASSFTFEQNNYSPENLSPIEVYRQTKNLLSQAKAFAGVS